MLTIALLLGSVDASRLKLRNYQAIQDLAEQETNESKPDDIATSNTDDMFAFSQIIASGQKVNEVTNALDAEAKKEANVSPDDDINAEILAFSNTLPGNDGAPVVVEETAADKQAAENEEAANAELAELYSNDATAAFANMVDSGTLSLAQTSSSSQMKIQSKSSAKQEQHQALDVLKALQKNLQNVLMNPTNEGLDQIMPAIQQAAAKTGQLAAVSEPIQQLAKIAQENAVGSSDVTMVQQPEPVAPVPIQTQAVQVVESVPEPEAATVQDQAADQSPNADLQKLNFSPEQLSYLRQLSSTGPNQASEAVQPAEEPEAQETPIDSVENQQQPADNDDDEKLADNHRKMAKIDLKKQEIKKLMDTHKALTSDALKQAKSGASMKRVEHNLNIAKNVAKRVEDLREQVQTDAAQLQKIDNADQLDQIYPFKKDENAIEHQTVGHVPSVQDSSTGERHSMDLLGNLVGTKSQNMDIDDAKLVSLESKKTETQKISKQVSAAEKKLKQAQVLFKTMSQEQAAFQKKQAEEMSQIQAIFSKGFAQIEKAKSIADEAGDDTEEAQDEIETTQETQPKIVAKKKDKPNALVQVTSTATSETQNQVQAQIAAQEAQMLQAGQEIKVEEMVDTEQMTTTEETDQLQQDTNDLIAQARQVLPMPQEEEYVQEEDQAALDAQASEGNAADEIQGLLGKLQSLTGVSDPAAALAQVKQMTGQK